MVKLKNIKRIDSRVAECDIYPEDSKESGHIVVDYIENSLIRYTLPKGYEWYTNHVSHAQWVLVEMMNENNPATERLVMWY